MSTDLCKFSYIFTSFERSKILTGKYLDVIVDLSHRKQVP